MRCRNIEFIRLVMRNISYSLELVTTLQLGHMHTQAHLKEQHKANPLIVFVNFLIALLLLGVADARVRHLAANFLQKHTFQGISGMDPAVCIQHILRYVFCVDAVDGIADILASGHNQRERHQDHDGNGIMQTKDWRINVNIIYFD